MDWKIWVQFPSSLHLLFVIFIIEIFNTAVKMRDFHFSYTIISDTSPAGDLLLAEEQQWENFSYKNLEVRTLLPRLTSP